MKLNKACDAEPGHKVFKRFHTGFRPVVLSSERYNGIVDRAAGKEQMNRMEAVAEEQRYKEYLKEGHEALKKNFTNLVDIEIIQDKLHAERESFIAETKRNAVVQAQLLDAARKKRILYANRLVHMLKPGPRTLTEALVESEMVHQRRQQQALKQEIEENSRRHQKLEDERCPETLIPFGKITEKEIKEQEKTKANELRASYLQDMEAKRVNKQRAKDSDRIEAIAQRARLECMDERDEQARKEQLAKKRAFCENAYRTALKEKAERVKFESMCDSIDDRTICVDKTTLRYMDGRLNKERLAMRQKRTDALEAHAVDYCRKMQAKRMQEEARADAVLEQAEFEAQVDEANRKAQIEKLAQERRQYEKEFWQREEKKQQREKEIKRFHLANRLKNAKVNSNFNECAKQKKEKETTELRNVLRGQRDDFIAQREEELMRMTACAEDPYLDDDVKFFDSAVQVMEESKEAGRPLYKINQAVEQYKRDNRIDVVPESKIISRNKARDACWPGYVSKAQLAYRNYEHRENCKREVEKKHQQIYENCLKITKMAAEESPLKQCVLECPMKLFQHRGMPALEDVSSFVLPKGVCEEPPSSIICREAPQTPCIDCSPLEVPSPCHNTTPESQELRASKSSYVNTSSKRPSAGKDSKHKFNNRSKSTVITRKPDLTRCWTAKPRPKVEVDNFPLISKINLQWPLKQSSCAICPENRKPFY